MKADIIIFLTCMCLAAAPGVLMLLHEMIPHRGGRVCRSPRCDVCQRMRAMGHTSYGRLL